MLGFSDFIHIWFGLDLYLGLQDVKKQSKIFDSVLTIFVDFCYL